MTKSVWSLFAGLTLGVALVSVGAESAANDRLLTDGKLVPSAVYRWEGKPIEVSFGFGAPREVGGVRITSGRSWVNCCVRKASFYALNGQDARSTREASNGQDARSTCEALAEHVAFGPANTFKEIWTSWKPVTCRGVKMVIEDTWDRAWAYYDNYAKSAFYDVNRMFGGPVWDLWGAGSWGSLQVDAETIAHPKEVDWIGDEKTVQIAELSFFGAKAPDDLPRPNAPDEAFPRTRLVRDWAYQDAAPGGNVSLVANTTADTTKPDRLGKDVGAFLEGVNGRDARSTERTEWEEGRWAKRRAFLKAFREKASQFVYVKHFIIGDSILYGTDDLTDWPWEEWRHCPDTTVPRASGLYLATIREDGTVEQEELLRTPVKGVIRDPAVSPDATRVAFSMRRTMDGDDYHLYVFDLKSRQVKQITFDGEYDGRKYPASDIEPCWLQDGSLVFQSTRCGQVLDCWPLPNSNLFRCEADGSRIRRLGFDEVSTFFPQLLDDGRVLFSRWEYNDRNSGYCNGLFTMFPDGTRQIGLALTNSPKPTSPLHARGIPGSTRVMFVDCGHHTGQKGRLAEVDPSVGDDYEAWTYSPSNAVYGTTRRPTKRIRWQGKSNVEIDTWPYGQPAAAAVRHLPGVHYLAGASTDGSAGRAPYPLPRFWKYPTIETGYAVVGPQWAYPHPLGEGRFLVSFQPEGDRFHRGPFSRNLGVYAMDETGRRELLAYDEANHCLQAVPVVARPLGPRARTKAIDYGQGLSVVSIQDVYRGAAVKGLKRGTIKKIRVVAIGYRAAYIGWNSQYFSKMVGTDGKIGTPVAVGNGTYDVKHVLGEADVEADGSCNFLVPSRTPVYYQLVDEKGCMVQTMRSWVTMMPGEASSCIGCHEFRNDAGASRTALALGRPPQKLRPAVPGLEHLLMAELEKKRPIDDLGVFMGVNRPECVDGTGATGAFSFPRHVQPILDRSCVRCHDGSRSEPPLNKLGGAPEKATCFDLRGVPGSLPSSDDNAHRAYTRGYLNLSCYGFCNDMINFSHGCDQVPFQQPYAFGASQSRYWQMLAKGHPNADGRPRVNLTPDELKTLALWIDLGVPFVGGYCERNTWTDVQKRRYLWFQNKRVYFAWQELNDIRREQGLAPVPIDGYVPGIDRPDKMKMWYD